MNQAPAGWYADPQNPQLQRYWDGAQWTTHTAPAIGQQQPAVAAEPGTVPAATPFNPYDKYFNLAELPEEHREAYKRHTLTEFPTWAVIVLSILTIGIFGVIYHGLKHSKLPIVKADDFTAGKAIGFLFIPFFNLYWVFVFWLRLVDRINFQYRLRGAPDPVSRDLTLWTIILSLLGFFLFPIPQILALVVGGQIQEAANRLVQGQVQPVALTAGAGPQQAVSPQTAPASQEPPART